MCAYRVVLMLSVGVTARRDSVTPAPKPARTVRGPVILPSASARRLLYWSKATNPAPPNQFWLLIFSCAPPASGQRTNPRLGRVANDQRRAPGIPLLAEWRPRQLLPCSQPAIELCPRLGDCRVCQSGRSGGLGNSGGRQRTFGGVCDGCERRVSAIALDYISCSLLFSFSLFSPSCDSRTHQSPGRRLLSRRGWIAGRWAP